MPGVRNDDMRNEDVIHFENEEKDTLQEIMNIAFGNAAADLASVIDIYVRLSVPEVEILESRNLPDRIHTLTKPYTDVKIITQHFWGDFQGLGLLLFPKHNTEDLFSIIEGHDEESRENPHLAAALENNMFMEVGNMLIGACVSKLAELLGTVVTYSPPLIVNNSLAEQGGLASLFAVSQKVIMLKTVFQFDKKDVSGFLMIVTSDESLLWLKKALRDFLAQY